MKWILLFIVLDLLAMAVLMRRRNRLPAKDAAHLLRKGALLIDVRMPQEFAAAHLPNAVNIPITGIDLLVPMRIQDKDQVLLLYGQMGMRSGLAEMKLKELGYSNAFNLGSYQRAAQIATVR